MLYGYPLGASTLLPSIAATPEPVNERWSAPSGVKRTTSIVGRSSGPMQMTPASTIRRFASSACRASNRGPGTELHRAGGRIVLLDLGVGA